ncbi:phosphoribosyltransferase family protein [Kitasatospora sp. GP82]|uniref:phosphoribosyltransferase family protein n=1 Tax=Kitasatospora sp. GP82 TaxID=3035089 RepID=UPI0024769CE9|nr:phosphoribosyltransferase family protein [Kitasatospora sp. GP82]MDH6125403.1 putative phosphoribosyl transferase [Kitasatospora sp. GP82]
MYFTDRRDAGRQLAARLAQLRGQDVVVVALPRGGVPVAAEVAEVLDAPLDICVIRKLGAPFQPELGLGAIGEGGVRVLNREVMRLAGVSEEQLAPVEKRERAELTRRVARYRGERPGVRLAGKTVVVVDDGVATGSSARAACRIVRHLGAARVVLAVPVAPTDWVDRLGEEADELVCVRTPLAFYAIGQFYQDFEQTSDAEVASCLDRAARRTAAGTAGDSGTNGSQDPAPDPHPGTREVELPLGGGWLGGTLTVPPGAVAGVVVFAHGSGSSRHSPRNRFVAERLNRAGLATLLFDLLTDGEAADRAKVFDIALLAERLAEATRWLREQPEAERRPLGYFGASTGAAAALYAAADPGTPVDAVVSRGGRPDLAGDRLPEVTAPTLLIVGGDDHLVLELNREAQARLSCESRLSVVPGATHLFEEPGTLAAAADLAADWFSEHLAAARR